MLLPLFEWCQESVATAAMTQSTWLVSVIELLHLLELTVLIGSVVVVSLRMFGLAMTRRPVSEVAGDLLALVALRAGHATHERCDALHVGSGALVHSGPFL